VIRNVVVHLSSEQPLLADIYALPSAGDAGLVCTNVRSLDGKRPVFIDRTDSVFFFPYLVIRFLEIPPAQVASHLAAGGDRAGVAGAAGPSVAHGDAQQGGPAPGDLLPVLVPEGETELDDDEPDVPDADLEIDEDFLRRIRDI
jgi:hypothetical protein